MSRTENFADKTFLVADPDTRIRKADDLMSFERFTAADPLPAGEQVGNFKRIAKGTRVKVDQVKVVPTGSSGRIVFAHALSENGATKLGWTSTRNFEGKFVNVTLGERPPAPGANRFGPNAAWSGGNFLKQITLVDIVDNRLEVERIALDTLSPYLDMVEAAAEDGVEVAINSGFRSFPEQKILHEGFIKKLPGFNLAAKPGRSKHQNGIAFDIAVAGGDGNPTYEWLKENAPGRGFVRTVNKEPWHWEFDQAKAKAAVKANTFKTGNVTV
jgi:D-alanyl-D-alanine carboxypeptidase